MHRTQPQREHTCSTLGAVNMAYGNNRCLFSDPHKTAYSQLQTPPVKVLRSSVERAVATVACAVVAPSMISALFSCYWLAVIVTRLGNCNCDAAGSLQCVQLRLISGSLSLSRGARVSEGCTVAFFAVKGGATPAGMPICRTVLVRRPGAHRQRITLLILDINSRWR